MPPYSISCSQIGNNESIFSMNSQFRPDFSVQRVPDSRISWIVLVLCRTPSRLLWTRCFSDVNTFLLRIWDRRENSSMSRKRVQSKEPSKIGSPTVNSHFTARRILFKKLGAGICSYIFYAYTSRYDVRILVYLTCDIQLDY